MIPRLPDIVIWPHNHKEVEEIVALADDCGVCVIPFGGGTSVSSALECPNDELRMIVSLDMTKMNKILWVDYENMTMCAEAGIIGEDLETQVISQLISFLLGFNKFTKPQCSRQFNVNPQATLI